MSRHCWFHNHSESEASTEEAEAKVQREFLKSKHCGQTNDEQEWEENQPPPSSGEFYPGIRGAEGVRMAQNSFTGRWNWTPCIGKGRSLQGSLAQETHSYTLEMSCFPWSLLLVLSPGHSFKWGVQPGISVSLLPFTCSKPAPVTYTGSKVSSWPSAHEMVLKTNIK